MSDDLFDDVKLAQLMASRLCHDLVGPLGAVSAGLELAGAAADGGEVDADALALAAKSAGQLTAKLTFLRVAFGAGSGSGDPVLEARGLSEKLLANTPVVLDWGLAPGVGGDGGKAEILAKLALNMVLIGAEALARGGRLSVRLTSGEGGTAPTLEIAAEGPRVMLKDELATVLSLENGGNQGKTNDIDGVSARAIQGVFCRQLAHVLGGALVMTRPEGGLLLRAGPLSLTA